MSKRHADTPYRRPAPDQRPAASEAVEAAIKRIHAVARPEIAQVFERALPMPLDTAVTVRDFDGKPDTFLLTGDIPAMWPRDATNAVWAYLPMVREDAALARVVEGVIHREAACINYDPYANAFYDLRFPASTADLDHPRYGVHADDHTAMKPGLHERKYELDTLAALLRLSVGYDDSGGDAGVFDADWLQAIRTIVATVRTQQAGSGEDEALPGGPPYTFQRTTPRASDTLVMHGHGPAGRRCGLSKSHFRPSDDASTLPYLVPSNAMAAVGLRGVAKIITRLGLDDTLAADCQTLGQELADAVRSQAVVPHPTAGDIFAYEIDGFGNHIHMDDANVPSLLALPYLGFCATDDDTYQRTRRYLWSQDNPFFAEGSAAQGIGGPHVGRSYIWPMSILVYALTSSDHDEIDRALRTVCATHAGRHVMHESFHKDNADDYTRHWFCWPNALFAELVLRLETERPSLLR